MLLTWNLAKNDFFHGLERRKILLSKCEIENTEIVQNFQWREAATHREHGAFPHICHQHQVWMHEKSQQQKGGIWKLSQILPLSTWKPSVLGFGITLINREIGWSLEINPYCLSPPLHDAVSRLLKQFYSLEIKRIHAKKLILHRGEKIGAVLFQLAKLKQCYWGLLYKCSSTSEWTNRS